MQFSDFSMQRPLWVMGKTPMDLTRTLVVIHIVTAIVVAITIGTAGGDQLNAFICSADSLRSLQIWTLLTYPFVHMVSIPLAIDLVVLWWFGSEVESFLGRKIFARLYAGLAVIPALAVLVLAPFLGDLALVGANEIHFAIFVGFALIYPRARLIFGIEAKWFAIVLVAISMISDMSYHQWMDFWYGWVLLGLVFGVLLSRGASGCLTIVGWFGATNQRLTGRFQQASTVRKRKKDENTERQIDEILDKVSEQGINSLTERERQVLDAASRKRGRK